MEMTQRLPNPGAMRLWIGLGVYALTMLASALVVRERPTPMPNVVLATVLSALGVLGMALVFARSTPYARWAHWTSALVFAGWTLASPWIAGSPAAWTEGARLNLWMMPWFVMITAAVGPRRTTGVCATSGSRAGAILVGASLVIGGFLMFAERIADFVMSLGGPRV